MIKTVYSFRRYAQNEVDSLCIAFQTCVSSMELGVLHVDATNSAGWTLGYSILENPSIFDKCLWDRYWALHPDVSLFWRLVHKRSLCIHRHVCVMAHLREALCSTPALWADLALVTREFQVCGHNSGPASARSQPVAYFCVFIQKQIDERRIREACRLAWITAVVQQ